jgi:hypothetical protein
VAFTRRRVSERRRPAGRRGARQAASGAHATNEGCCSAFFTGREGKDKIRSRRTTVLCWPRSGLSTRTRTRSLRSIPLHRSRCLTASTLLLSCCTGYPGDNTGTYLRLVSLFVCICPVNLAGRRFIWIGCIYILSYLSCHGMQN